MKTFILATASALALATLATAATAQDVGKVYGSIGVQNQDNKKTDTNLGSVDLTLGTKLTPNFGVEAQTALGTGHDTTAAGQYKLTSKWAAYGVGYLPVSSNIDLLARAGVSDTDLKAPAASGKLDQGTAFDYGVGAQYHFNNSYAARVDLTKSDFQNHKGSANTTSVNLVKTF